MQKIKSYLNKALTVFFFATIATSCSKDGDFFDLEGTEDGKAIKHRVSIAISSGENHTKASIDGLKFQWTEGDTLGLHNNATPLVAAPFTSMEEGTKGVVECEMYFRKKPNLIFAVYPYNKEQEKDFKWDKSNPKNPEMLFKIKREKIQTQNFIDGKIDPQSIGKYSYLLGRTQENVGPDSLINIQMRHAMAYVDIHLDNIAPDDTVKTVKLSSNHSFSSSAWVNFAKKGNVMNFVSPSPDNMVTLKLTSNGKEGVTSQDGTLVVRFALLPQAIDTETQWKVEVEKTSGSPSSNMMKTFTTPTRLVQGSRYEWVRVFNVGDLYQDNDKMGIICYVDESKKHGKIISLDETYVQWATPEYRTHWISDAICTPQLPETGAPIYIEDATYWDGKGNTQIIKQYCLDNGLPFDATTFPSAAWCDAKNSEAFSGWYLPATGEIIKYITENKIVLNRTLVALRENNPEVVALNDALWSSNQRGDRKTDARPSVNANMIRMINHAGFMPGDQVPIAKDYMSNFLIIHTRAMADF